MNRAHLKISSLSLICLDKIEIIPNNSLDIFYHVVRPAQYEKNVEPDLRKSKTTRKGTKIKDIKRLSPKKDFTIDKKEKL